MKMELLLGALLVAVAGLGTGTYVWPLKRMRRYTFDHCWMVGMFVMLVVLPWTVTFIGCPDVPDVLAKIDTKVILLGNFFSTCFGLAVLLFGVCVVRIGVALAGPILSGTSVVIGVLLPLIVRPAGFDAPPLFSLPGLAVLAGLVCMIGGVFLVARAGFAKAAGAKREPAASGEQKRAGSFLVGLVLAILAGALSTGISFTFVYTQETVTAAMQQAGAGTTVASVGVWAIGMMGAAVVNVGYPAILISRRGQWDRVLDWRDAFLAALLGLHFGVAVMFLLGRGMVLLGPLGASVGFGIQQAIQILGNQGLGAIFGEWKGVAKPVLRTMVWAVAVILLATAILAAGPLLAGH
jgi:hypothetical protein